MAQGSGSRPWTRGNEAARAASTYVVPNGDLIVTDEGNIYAGDGVKTAAQLTRVSSLADFTGVSQASVVTQGAKADYTGRIGTVGTGTDDRAAIQRALDAASNLSGSGYYNYLGRRSVTVKLPAGHYLIGAPASGPSLRVPAGVTFDTSDAGMFFDYPTAVSNDWCGIGVEQYGNLIVGKVTPSRRNTAPSSADVYDGVRLLFTDNNSRLIGYKDSEISGFQGAQARGIGAYISHVKGIRFSGRYCYVATNYGDAFTFPIPAGNPSGTRRVHTDIYFEDCQFVNTNVAGFVGATTGTAAAINGLDFNDSGLVPIFKNCVWENIGGYALSLGNVLNASMIDCSLEEVGSGDGMINLDTVRAMTVVNLRVNFAGRSVPGPAGNVTPNPSCVFKMASVQSFTLSSFYIHNTYRPTFKLAEGQAPGGYSVGPGFWDGTYGLSAGGAIPISTKGASYISADWSKGHFQLGADHMWVDNGVMRFKSETPVSATDGAVVGAADLLTVGEATMDRRQATSASINCPAGTLRLTYARALRTETVNNLRIVGGATAATGATLVRMGVFSVDPADGTLTLIAATASDVTVLSSANSSYTRALTTPFNKVAGRRYAYGILVVGSSNTPNTWGLSMPSSAEAALPPRLAGLLSAQSDLPSTIADSALSGNAGMAYMALS